MSGTTSARAHAKVGPVRPKPVSTSSAISSTPAARVRSRIARSTLCVPHAHPSRSEQQRLHDDGGQLPAPRGEQAVQRRDRRGPARLGAGVGKPGDLEQVLPRTAR